MGLRWPPRLPAEMSEEVENQAHCGPGGYVVNVQVGCDFDDIHGLHRQRLDYASEDLNELNHCEAAGLWCSCARCEGGIQHVDVDGQIYCIV